MALRTMTAMMMTGTIRHGHSFTYSHPKDRE